MKRMFGGIVLLAVLSVPVAAQDTMAVTPVVTLAEALERSARLDPDYVGALGTVESAEWGRRAARLAFILPSVSVGLDVTKYSSGFFNLGTGELQSTSVTARADARYELFSLRKLAELSRAGAALDAANADEARARFAAALLTEQEYYAVLAGHELLASAEQQVQRAEEGLKVARARVASGAVVQSDSLQLVLDLTDTGIGLPQDRERLTEPYMTTRVRGTGLGLAIVKKIVEEHLGEIAFLDRAGGGTRVRIAFDADRLALLESDEPPAPATSGDDDEYDEEEPN